MVFKENPLEKLGLAGCVSIPLLNGIIGAFIGWFCTPENPGEVEGMSESLSFLFMMIGFCVGGFCGCIEYFIIGRIFKRRQESEEF